MSRKKILVIDDNPVIIRLDESLLGSQNYDVIKAVDGEEGFKKAKEEKPDIIFLDIILPGIHGFAQQCHPLQRQDGEYRGHVFPGISLLVNLFPWRQLVQY